MNHYRIRKLRAEAYRYLQAVALIRCVYERQRELVHHAHGTIDPYQTLTCDEQEKARDEFCRT